MDAGRVKSDMRLLRILIAALAVGGGFVSYLALKVHLQDPGAAPPCAVTEHFDCGAVNHSRWAVFPPRGFDEAPDSRGHVPVAALGIAAYAVIIVVALAGFDFLLFELCQTGFFLALGLTFIEKYILEKWCVYCLWSQAAMAALLVASAANLYLSRRRTRQDGLRLRPSTSVSTA